MPGLEPVVQDDVRQHAAPETGQERSRLARLDPFEAPAQQGLWRDTAVGLQHQRIEEERAELAVAGPGFALAQPLEGADVHEHGLRAAPLDVVRRAVLEHEPLGQRLVEQRELQQRRVAQHLERPLVRVRDERQPFVPQQARLELLGRDDAPVLERPPEEARALERVPVLPRARRQLTEHLARGGIHNPRLGIAKGGGLRSASCRARHPCGCAGFAARGATSSWR